MVCPKLQYISLYYMRNGKARTRFSLTIHPNPRTRFSRLAHIMKSHQLRVGTSQAHEIAITRVGLVLNSQDDTKSQKSSCGARSHLDVAPSCWATAGVAVSPWRRAILFVDNAGADVVLGMVPLARELLRMGAEVRTHHQFHLYARSINT